MDDLRFGLELGPDKTPVMLLRLPLGRVPVPSVGPITTEIIGVFKGKLAAALPESWRERLQSLAELRESTVEEINSASQAFEAAQSAIRQAWRELAPAGTHREAEQIREQARRTHEIARERLARVESLIRDHRAEGERHLYPVLADLGRNPEVPGLEVAGKAVAKMRSIALEHGAELAAAGMRLQAMGGLLQRNGLGDLHQAVVGEAVADMVTSTPKLIQETPEPGPFSADGQTRVQPMPPGWMKNHVNDYSPMVTREIPYLGGYDLGNPAE